jgi:putative methyltransferase
MYGVHMFQLRCIKTFIVKAVLREVIEKANLVKEERRLSSPNLVLVLVHDLLLARGIQAGDGPIKQAVLRHKTRLNGELQKIKIKRGATSSDQLAQNGGEQAGSPSHTSPYLTPFVAQLPRYVRVNTCLGSLDEAVKSFSSRGFSHGNPFLSKYVSEMVRLTFSQFLRKKMFHDG